MEKINHGIVKVTTSGQVTLPKSYRDEFDTKLYSYEIDGESLLVRPVIFLPGRKIEKYSKQDAKKFVFSSKNKGEHNLANKIDQELYGTDWFQCFYSGFSERRSPA